MLTAETLMLPKPGLATFTERGLSIASHASESDLLDIGHRLFAVRGSIKWMMGSLFAAMIEKRDGGAPADRHGKEDGGAWLAQFTDAQELDPKERREILGTYLFWRGANFKGVGGSFAMHYEAMLGGAMSGQQGALDRALAYLTHAHTHGLSVTQLRRHIRTTQATDHPEPEQQELGNYGVIFDLRRWCARELPNVSTYSAERAALILSDLGEETIEYIDALRRIANGDSKGVLREACQG